MTINTKRLDVAGRLRHIAQAIADFKREHGEWPYTFKDLVPYTMYADPSGVGQNVNFAASKGFVVPRPKKCHGFLVLTPKGCKKYAPDLAHCIAKPTIEPEPEIVEAIREAAVADSAGPITLPDIPVGPDIMVEHPLALPHRAPEKGSQTRAIVIKDATGDLLLELLDRGYTIGGTNG